MTDALSSTSQEERPFRIYVCGSYRDIEGNGREAKSLLRRVETALRADGFDAYTQLHPRAKDLAGDLKPAPMTRKLEEVSDLVVYIGTPTAREGGWVAELSDIQARYPEGAWKRAVLVHENFHVSGVLDNAQEGHLSEPFVPIIEWASEAELIKVIERLAVHLHERGSLPRATARKGRIRL